MPITLGTLNRVRFFPEMLPDTFLGTLAAGLNLPSTVLNIRDFAQMGLWLRLKDICVAQNANVRMRIMADNRINHDINLAGIANYTPEAFDIEIKESILFNFAASAGTANWRSYYNVWVYKPSVCDKLSRGKALTGDEGRIAQEKDLVSLVQQGIAPSDLSYLTEREYKPYLDQWPEPMLLTAIPATTKTLINRVMVNAGEILIITGIAAEPMAFAEGGHLLISRDDDDDYIDLHTFPMALATWIPCFIPAKREVSFYVRTAAPVAAWMMKYRIARVPLIDVYRARWGESISSSLIAEKVKGGII